MSLQPRGMPMATHNDRLTKNQLAAFFGYVWKAHLPRFLSPPRSHRLCKHSCKVQRQYICSGSLQQALHDMAGSLHSWVLRFLTWIGIMRTIHVYADGSASGPEQAQIESIVSASTAGPAATENGLPWPQQQASRMRGRIKSSTCLVLQVLPPAESICTAFCLDSVDTAVDPHTMQPCLYSLHPCCGCTD